MPSPKRTNRTVLTLQMSARYRNERLKQRQNGGARRTPTSLKVSEDGRAQPRFAQRTPGKPAPLRRLRGSAAPPLHSAVTFGKPWPPPRPPPASGCGPAGPAPRGHRTRLPSLRRQPSPAPRRRQPEPFCPPFAFNRPLKDNAAGRGRKGGGGEKRARVPPALSRLNLAARRELPAPPRAAALSPAPPPGAGSARPKGHSGARAALSRPPELRLFPPAVPRRPPFASPLRARPARGAAPPAPHLAPGPRGSERSGAPRAGPGRPPAARTGAPRPGPRPRLPALPAAGARCHPPAGPSLPSRRFHSQLPRPARGAVLPPPGPAAPPLAVPPARGGRERGRPPRPGPALGAAAGTEAPGPVLPPSRPCPSRHSTRALPAVAARRGAPGPLAAGGDGGLRPAAAVPE